MTITLTGPQIVLAVAQAILLVFMASQFKMMTSGGGDAGMIGLMMWFGMGIFLEIILLLTYFSSMYLFFT